MRFRVNRFLIVACLAVEALVAQQGKGPAPSKTVPSAQTDSDAADVVRRLDALQRRADELSERLDSELRAADKRFEGVTHSTDRAFNVLALLGAFGSFLGGLIVLLSWLRTRKSDKLQRSDYERERDFYENRVRATEEHNRTSYERERTFYESRMAVIDQRNSDSQQIGLDLWRDRSQREDSTTKQQLELGDSVLSHSGDLLTKQIESITKLGDVIGLVEKTFNMQFTRVSDVDKLVTRLGETDAVISSFTKHFREQYKHVSDLMLTFNSHSRMDWTRLTEHEATLASRALTIFDTIPANVLEGILTEENGKHRYDIAHLYQLLGVSAFYTNDIDAATRYLERGLQIYGKEDAPTDYLFLQAFCSHYLGLVEKNWCHADRALDVNLSAARQHFEDAHRRLKNKEGEFLTPVTLAEVLSYSDQTWRDAHNELDNIVDRFEKRRTAKQGIDESQNALYGRALLLKGNIFYQQNDNKQAAIWFSRAKDHDPKNPYALLSLAQATAADDQDTSNAGFATGLAQLLESGALHKREHSSRLIAVAWAAIAARIADDINAANRFVTEIEQAAAAVRPVGGRAPLFFCPITKKLVQFAQLKKNIVVFVRGRDANTDPAAEKSTTN
ncbi:MAG TPA: hypothetical protein VGG72_20380 [Bryobacteraceae bacterium]